MSKRPANPKPIWVQGLEPSLEGTLGPIKRIPAYRVTRALTIANIGTDGGSVRVWTQDPRKIDVIGTEYQFDTEPTGLVNYRIHQLLTGNQTG